MFLEASPIQQFHKRSLNLNIITILITDATWCQHSTKCCYYRQRIKSV